MEFNGRKYACDTCIRGHRANKCRHVGESRGHHIFTSCKIGSLMCHSLTLRLLERSSTSRNHKERQASKAVRALSLPAAITLASYKMSLRCKGVGHIRRFFHHG